MSKKLSYGVLALVLASIMSIVPSAGAKSPPSPNKPGSGPVPTVAVHTSNLFGQIEYNTFNTTSDVVEGVVTLEVDQPGVLTSIVFVNLQLPSGFTWGGDETVTVTSNEDGGGPVTVWTQSVNGSELSISGLSLTNTDTDGIVEFSVSVATVTGITTTSEVTGLYGVSSQYRTNPTRKIKEQTWVISTPGKIDINVTQAITWEDQDADAGTAPSGGSATYTTGSAVATIPTVPIRAGYTFGGWNTAANGLGASVTDGSYTPGAPYGAVTFYAKWTADTNNPITWDDQGAETASSGGSATYTTGSAVAAIPTTDPIRAGYTFGGWNTAADGTGDPVTDGFTPGAPYGAVTFYAQWLLEMGSTGPGGGIIFYYDSAGFNCGTGFTNTGSPTGGLCHYLEYAPDGWAPSLLHDWTNVDRDDGVRSNPTDDPLLLWSPDSVWALGGGQPGFDTSSITAVDFTSATARYTSAGHTFRVGDKALIAGFDPVGYNGLFTITDVASDTFTVANTTNLTVVDGTGTVKTNRKQIGAGRRNTLEIQTAGNDIHLKWAYNSVLQYSGGTQTDWYIPAIYELRELCKWANGQTTGDTTVACVAGTISSSFTQGIYAPGSYWSSNQSLESDYRGVLMAFTNPSSSGVSGEAEIFYSSWGESIRPIRAF